MKTSQLDPTLLLPDFYESDTPTNLSRSGSKLLSAQQRCCFHHRTSSATSEVEFFVSNGSNILNSSEFLACAEIQAYNSRLDALQSQLKSQLQHLRALSDELEDDSTSEDSESVRVQLDVLHSMLHRAQAQADQCTSKLLEKTIEDAQLLHRVERLEQMLKTPATSTCKCAVF